MQERRNSIVYALELHFSCINPSILCDMIMFLCVHSQVSMVVADGLVHFWHQGISNYHDDICQLKYIRRTLM